MGDCFALVVAEISGRFVMAGDGRDGLNAGIDRANQGKLAVQNVMCGILRADADQVVVSGELFL